MKRGPWYPPFDVVLIGTFFGLAIGVSLGSALDIEIGDQLLEGVRRLWRVLGLSFSGLI